MSSNFKLIRRFFELVNQYSSQREELSFDFEILNFNTENFKIEYRNYLNPDVIIRKDGDNGIYLFDFNRFGYDFKELENKSITVVEKDRNKGTLIQEDFEKDIFDMDDIEFILKHGREYTDDKIISKLQNNFDSMITMNDFKNFLGE